MKDSHTKQIDLENRRMERKRKRSVVFEKLAEGLGDWVERPATVKDLIEVSSHAQAANGHGDEAPIG